MWQVKKINFFENELEENNTIEVVNISMNKIQDTQGIEGLGQLKNLKAIDLSDNPICTKNGQFIFHVIDKNRNIQVVNNEELNEMFYHDFL